MDEQDRLAVCAVRRATDQTAGAVRAQHMSVRVVPKSVRWHFGLECAFKVMTVGASDVVYTEANGSGRLVLGATEVEAFAMRYDKIGVKPSRRPLAEPDQGNDVPGLSMGLVSTAAS
jgi:hypothetical protein